MPTHRVSLEHPEPHIIEQAARYLQAGLLVAFPTETVYGLGAHAMDPEAVARIYELTNAAEKAAPSASRLSTFTPLMRAHHAPWTRGYRGGAIRRRTRARRPSRAR